jgi:ABC-type amino acid transport substrate-binding protein
MLGCARIPEVWTVLVVFLLAGTTLGAAERSVLRVGMDTRSRPWASVPGLDYSKEDWAKAPTVTAAQLKRIEGIDIDVMKALAARMNRVPEIVPWPWDGIEDGLLSKSMASLRAGTLVPVDDSDKLFDQLAAAAVDAVVEDSTYVRWRIATDGQFRAVGERLNRHGYHVALRREDRALYEAVQAATRDLTASGEIDRIRKRWESPQP